MRMRSENVARSHHKWC